jgi:pimeloyl-ACP methyl ester carboxylesterase
MAASDLQLALMSERVYLTQGGEPVSPNWELLLDANQAGLGDLKGYFGAAWYNKQTGELVLAHRGTEADSWKDWMADAQAIFGIGNEQVSVAKAFRLAALAEADRQGYTVARITHTGHSLGGCISQVLAALRPNEHALTFNPLGAGQLLSAYGIDPAGSYDNIRNVRSWFDPAAAASTMIGQTYRMPISTYPFILEEAEFAASVLFGAIAFKFVGPAGLVAVQLQFRVSQHSMANLREVIDAAGGIVDMPLPNPPSNWQDFQAALESNPALLAAATAPEYSLLPGLSREEIRFELSAEGATRRFETGTGASDFMAGADGADALDGGASADLLYGGLGVEPQEVVPREAEAADGRVGV